MRRAVVRQARRDAEGKSEEAVEREWEDWDGEGADGGANRVPFVGPIVPHTCAHAPVDGGVLVARKSYVVRLELTV